MNKLKLPFMAVTVALLIGVSSCATEAPKGSTPDTGKTAGQAEQTPGTKSHDAYAAIPANQIQRGGTDVDFLWDPKDPYFGFNKSEAKRS